MREIQLRKERDDELTCGSAEGYHTVKNWKAIRSFKQVAAAWNDANPSHKISRQRAEEIHESAIKKLREALEGLDREWWGNQEER